MEQCGGFAMLVRVTRVVRCQLWTDLRPRSRYSSEVQCHSRLMLTHELRLAILVCHHDARVEIPECTDDDATARGILLPALVVCLVEFRWQDAKFMDCLLLCRPHG